MGDVNGPALKGNPSSGGIADRILFGMDRRQFMPVTNSGNVRRTRQKAIVARRDNTVLMLATGNNHTSDVKAFTA